MSSKSFGINILTDNQVEMAKKCTQRGGGPLSNNEVVLNANQVPVINGSLAFLECERTETFQGGDHTIVMARVLNLRAQPDAGNPLVFYKSQFTTTADTAIPAFPARKAS